MLYKRALESRSYLRFDYPGPNNTIEQTLYLPFFENIEVAEGQKANYAVYDLLSRAGNLYAYMGAKSRSLNVKFSMTLPHIKHYITTEGLESVFGPSKRINSKQNLRDEFLKKGTGSVFNQSQKQKDLFRSLTGRTDLLGVENAFDKALENMAKPVAFGDVATITSVAATQTAEALQNGKAQSSFQYNQKDNRAINLFMFWVNMVRTSVINHSSNVNQGPPIITLTHGIMYNQIPCVCTNFSINIDKSAGYHLETMTPRKIDVLLNLEEVRTGNWGNYRRGNKVDGNNLPGWDSFIKYETMDPYGNIL